MELSEQIEQFQEFLDKFYHAELSEQLLKGKNFLNTDFNQLAQFSPELAEQLLETPEETIKATEIATEQFDVKGNKQHFKIRFFNLPESNILTVSEIASKHINRFFCVKGRICSIYDLEPLITNAKFECSTCTNTINVLQLDTKLKEPAMCTCGRKGRFRLVNREITDSRIIIIEESLDDLHDNSYTMQRKNVILLNDLANPQLIQEGIIGLGKEVKVNCTIRFEQKRLRTGELSTKMNCILEANSIETKDKEEEIILTEDDRKRFEEMTKKHDMLQVLAKNFAPRLIIASEIKKAIILQMIGCPKRPSLLEKRFRTPRTSFHILLIGDSATAKSQITKAIRPIALKYIYTSASTASRGGLTVMAIKDPKTGTFSLEVGPMVLASNGILAIDELNNIKQEDQTGFNEAFSEEEIHFNKGGINATIKFNTNVLGIANPVHGNFSVYQNVPEQLGIHPSTLTRFDLYFVIRDRVDERKDKEVATNVMASWWDEEPETEITPAFYKKFIKWAKEFTPQPPLPGSEARLKIAYYFAELRKLDTKYDEAGQRDKGTINISNRYIEALVRLSEAIARTRHKDVDMSDVDEAYNIIRYHIDSICRDETTDTLNLSILNPDTSLTKTEQAVKLLKEIIHSLEKENQTGLARIDQIEEKWQQSGRPLEELEKIMFKLREVGDIFNPKPNTIKYI